LPGRIYSEGTDTPESRPRQWPDCSSPFYNTLSASLESRPRQWADCSSPFYNNTLSHRVWNPAHGSGRIVQVHTIHVEIKINSKDLKYPPTPVGGINIPV
jgi:hypothetical protein